MEFRVLGPLEVARDGHAVQVVGSRERTILAILLSSPNQVVSRDRLVDELWCGRPPEDASGALRVFVSRLRRALREGGTGELLQTRPPGWLAAVDHGAVDAERFEGLTGDAREHAEHGRHHEALAAFGAALALWRGPAYADVAGSPAVRAEAARLEELRLAAVEGRAEAQLACGRAGEAAAQLELVTREHPFRERLWALRMRALYATGRQAEALEAYREVRRLLAEELGLEPGPELVHLEAAILRHAPELETDPAAPGAGPAGIARQRPRHNLPAFLAPFVGRERELAELAGLVGQARLITLTGVGGVGKTRLAVQAAAAATDRFRDGVWMTDLVPLREAERVPAAVADALGLETAGGAAEAELPARLSAVLADRDTLLVLDNCEHLVDAVADLVGRLLPHCPQLTVLASSRERLGIAGEIVWVVPPLTLPQEAADLALVQDADAVRFFCERAVAARSDLTLTEAATRAVARICRRLEGIPLALELAASRVRVLGVVQLAARLDDRFGMSAGAERGGDARHRTLRATVGWSYDLLSARERDALAALSVFPQSFDVEAAEAVITDDQSVDAVDLLCRLVDKSLVVVLPDDGCGPRYRLLETIREYAAERLVEAGAEEAVRQRHCATFVARIEGWRGSHFSSERLQGATADADNLRSALEWSGARGDADAVLRLVPALWMHWYWSGDPHGRAWIERTATAPEYSTPALDGHPGRVDALVAHGIDLLGPDPGPSFGMFAEAAALAERHGDVRGVALTHQTWGEGHTYFDTVAESRRHLEIALDAWRRLDVQDGVGWCHYHLAWAALAEGDVAGARGQLELAERRCHDDTAAGWLGPHVQSALAPLLARAGETDRAFALAADAIATARPLRSRPVLVMTLVRAADTAFLAGCPATATGRLVEALGLLAEAGMVRWLGEALELAALVLAGARTPGPAAEALGAARAVRRTPNEAQPVIRALAPELTALPAELTRVLGEDGFRAHLTRGQERTAAAAIRRTVDALTDGAFSAASSARR